MIQQVEKNGIILNQYHKYVMKGIIKMDYNRFIETNPYHLMEIPKDEWHGEGYDIPLEAKVLEFPTEKDENSLNELKKRITIARKYLNSLSEQHKLI